MVGKDNSMKAHGQHYIEHGCISTSEERELHNYPRTASEFGS